MQRQPKKRRAEKSQDPRVRFGSWFATKLNEMPRGFQTSLAKELNVSVDAISLWKSGARMPRPRYLTQIARALRVPLSEIESLLSYSITEPIPLIDSPSNSPSAEQSAASLPLLPYLPPSVLVRESEFQALLKQIRDGRNVINLYGQGGVGKNTFANSLVNRVVEEFAERGLKRVPPISFTEFKLVEPFVGNSRHLVPNDDKRREKERDRQILHYLARKLDVLAANPNSPIDGICEALISRRAAICLTSIGNSLIPSFKRIVEQLLDFIADKQAAEAVPATGEPDTEMQSMSAAENGPAYLILLTSHSPIRVVGMHSHPMRDLDSAEALEVMLSPLRPEPWQAEPVRGLTEASDTKDAIRQRELIGRHRDALKAILDVWITRPRFLRLLSGILRREERKYQEAKKSQPKPHEQIIQTEGTPGSADTFDDGGTRYGAPRILEHLKTSKPIDSDEDIYRFCFTLLDTEQQQLLCRLALFVGPFSAEAAWILGACAPDADMGTAVSEWRCMAADSKSEFIEKLRELRRVEWLKNHPAAVSAVFSADGAPIPSDTSERYMLSANMRAFLCQWMGDNVENRNGASELTPDEGPTFISREQIWKLREKYLLYKAQAAGDGNDWEPLDTSDVSALWTEYDHLLKEYRSQALASDGSDKQAPGFARPWTPELRPETAARGYIALCSGLIGYLRAIGYSLYAADALACAVHLLKITITSEPEKPEMVTLSGQELKLRCELGRIAIWKDWYRLADTEFATALGGVSGDKESVEFRTAIGLNGEKSSVDRTDDYLGFSFLGRAIVDWERGRDVGRVETDFDMAHGLFESADRSYLVWLCHLWRSRFYVAEGSYDMAEQRLQDCLSLAFYHLNRRAIAATHVDRARLWFCRYFAGSPKQPVAADELRYLRSLLGAAGAYADKAGERAHRLQFAHLYALTGLYIPLSGENRSPNGDDYLNDGLNRFRQMGDTYWRTWYQINRYLLGAAMNERGADGSPEVWLENAVTIWRGELAPGNQHISDYIGNQMAPSPPNSLLKLMLLACERIDGRMHADLVETVHGWADLLNQDTSKEVNSDDSEAARPQD